MRRIQRQRARGDTLRKIADGLNQGSYSQADRIAEVCMRFTPLRERGSENANHVRHRFQKRL